MRTHYESLKVTEDAPPEVIRAAYRALSLKHHPDRCDGSPRSKQTMQALNEAYAVLSDPHQRAAYDGDLQRARRSVPSPGVESTPPASASFRVRRSTPIRLSRPIWLKSALLLFSDARVVLPLVAVIWLLVYWLLSHM